ncbi:hypothetical protein IMSHALPRED_005858 [Imshaugia aleurites]|uniref:Asl1-like glycosyl hydrolase catalytic domain-containing protein n=1 Tax=Imshaugia aleurites TaxID=172621 RepID=A0A8H3FBV4_9LECA|nr:hypothetical protein IMSHALPRED_005858 [Imshaugia aleurites]
MAKKRCLLWDWTNTNSCPEQMEKVNFNGPMHSVSNWNAWTPPELKGRASFRPMVHDAGKLSGNDWAMIQGTQNGIIHFFNEPERNGISTQQAADAWNNQLLPLRNQGNKLVSPSCASDETGHAWIADFMSKIASNPPDYLGVHYYGTDGNAAIEYIQNIHNLYPDQPIIVSEIASTARDLSSVVGFTVQVANWMDGTDYVFEYGFFGCMKHLADDFVSPAAQLMNPDGSFTDLMYKLMYDQRMHN